MSYDYQQALNDLIGQIRAMKNRSELYESEERDAGKLDEAEKHLRAFCILKELERLGKAFESRVDPRNL